MPSCLFSFICKNCALGTCHSILIIEIASLPMRMGKGNTACVLGLALVFRNSIILGTTTSHTLNSNEVTHLVFARFPVRLLCPLRRDTYLINSFPIFFFSQNFLSLWLICVFMFVDLFISVQIPCDILCEPRAVPIVHVLSSLLQSMRVFCCALDKTLQSISRSPHPPTAADTQHTIPRYSPPMTMSDASIFRCLTKIHFVLSCLLGCSCSF